MLSALVFWDLSLASCLLAISSGHFSTMKKWITHFLTDFGINQVMGSYWLIVGRISHSIDSLISTTLNLSIVSSLVSTSLMMFVATGVFYFHPDSSPSGPWGTLLYIYGFLLILSGTLLFLLKRRLVQRPMKKMAQSTQSAALDIEKSLRQFIANNLNHENSDHLNHRIGNLESAIEALALELSEQKKVQFRPEDRNLKGVAAGQ